MATREMRILLVDDDADSSELLGELLRRAGHHVRFAADSGAALDQIPAFEPELAIIDIGLPGMNGYDLARELRALAPCGLIALSGSPAERGETRRAEFDHYLTKPVDLAALLRAIATVGALSHGPQRA